MLHIARIVFPSKRFMELKDDLPRLSSFIFVTSQHCVWRNKGKKLGSIYKYTNDTPVASVSTNQLQSYQPILVPKFWGKVASAIIWATLVMVVQLMDVFHVHLMWSTRQEKTLTVISSFEQW